VTAFTAEAFPEVVRDRFHSSSSLDNSCVSENKGERWLIVETSGRRGQVALAEGSTINAIRALDETRRHARDLAPAVGDLLKEKGWRPRDLTGVIVSRGPGSYTGLRVGIASAKAFAYATASVLIAVDTFAAVAAQAPSKLQLLDVIGDAQQEKVYLQQFSRQDGNSDLHAVTSLAIVEFSTWLTGRDSAAWVSGPGLHRFQDRLPPRCLVVDAALWDPTADSLLRLGRARYARGERDDLYTLEPLYLRPSSAEEQWARRQTS
jgi:tRNA threonylcarbamoyladenosine biosynthesis protein TsaB